MPTPDGTKPWRKSYRKRWRAESSYRKLNPLQRCLLQFIEDNADDEGTVVTTERYLAAMVSTEREPISRQAVGRALQALARLEQVTVSPGQRAGQEAGQGTRPAQTVIKRLKFKEYQEPKVNEPASEPGQEAGQRAGRSSRGEQRIQRDLFSGGSAAQKPSLGPKSTASSRDLGRVLGVLAKNGYRPRTDDAPADRGAILRLLASGKPAREVYATVRVPLRAGAATVHGGLSKEFHGPAGPYLAASRAAAECEWDLAYPDPANAPRADGGADREPQGAHVDRPPLPPPAADWSAEVGAALGYRGPAGELQDGARVEHGPQRGPGSAGPDGGPGGDAR